MRDKTEALNGSRSRTRALFRERIADLVEREREREREGGRDEIVNMAGPYGPVS